MSGACDALGTVLTVDTLSTEATVPNATLLHNPRIIP